nr:hypothetical protein [Caballeronia sp. ATUFL_M2_KS44]
MQAARVFSTGARRRLAQRFERRDVLRGLFGRRADFRVAENLFDLPCADVSPQFRIQRARDRCSALLETTQAKIDEIDGEHRTLPGVLREENQIVVFDMAMHIENAVKSEGALARPGEFGGKPVGDMLRRETNAVFRLQHRAICPADQFVFDNFRMRRESFVAGDNLKKPPGAQRETAVSDRHAVTMIRPARADVIVREEIFRPGGRIGDESVPLNEQYPGRRYVFEELPHDEDAIFFPGFDARYQTDAHIGIDSFVGQENRVAKQAMPSRNIQRTGREHGIQAVHCAKRDIAQVDFFIIHRQARA